MEFRKVTFIRCVQAIAGLGLAIHSAVGWPAEMIRANASVTPIQKFGSTALVAGFYLLIAAFSLKDVRASSWLSVAYTVLSTPVFALLLLSSGWSPVDAEATNPFLLPMLTGNAILFFVSAYGIASYPRPENLPK